MNFESIDSLKSVQAILDEADKALNKQSRKTSDSSIAKSFVPAAVGASIWWSTEQLFSTGPLLLTTGPLLPLAPVVFYIKKQKELPKVKELLYKNAIEKQNAILKALMEERNSDKQTIEELKRINDSLQDAIKKLMNDLKQK